MFTILWNLGAFIVALGLIVTIHEYGHFWVARKCGIRVERFSIGFGKTLFRRFDKHGTEFVIALIPLGGYVKMLDSRIDDITENEKSMAFNHKSVYQRIAVVAAGPIANFIIAIFAFYFMFLIGSQEAKPVIGDLKQSSIASVAQLQTNQQIISINGRETIDWKTVNMALMTGLGEDSIDIATAELGTTYIKHYQLDTSNWELDPSKQSAISGIGIVPYMPKVTPIIANVAPETPGEIAGLKVSDEIISVNGDNIYGNWQDFVDIIQRNPNNSVSIGLKRNDKFHNIDLIVGTREGSDGHMTGYVGIYPTVEPWPKSHIVDISYGPIDSMGKAVEGTWGLVTLTFNMIGKLFDGTLGVENLSGPISIAQGAGNSAGMGLTYFLYFLALISVNLGIINLFPLPVLDGGHLFYYFIELVSGRPVPEKIQEFSFKIGALILLSLMGLALFNDFARL